MTTSLEGSGLRAGLFANLILFSAFVSLRCDDRRGRMSRAECERYVTRWFEGPHWKALVDDARAQIPDAWNWLFEDCLRGNTDRTEYECLLRSTTSEQDLRCTWEGTDRRERRRSVF